MTNAKIIYDAAITAGLYTEDEAAALLMACGSLPLHTFAEWKRLGFFVKKGEKARLKCWLWKYTTNPNKAAREEAEAAGEELAEDPHYYKKLSYLFTLDQVERAGKGKSADKKPAALVLDDNDQLCMI